MIEGTRSHAATAPFSAPTKDDGERRGDHHDGRGPTSGRKPSDKHGVDDARGRPNREINAPRDDGGRGGHGDENERHGDREY